MSRILIATKLMPETVEVLDAAADRIGRSRAATLELLINSAATTLTADTLVPAGAIPIGSRRPG